MVIGLYYASHERITHNVCRSEMLKGNASDAIEDMQGMDEA